LAWRFKGYTERVRKGIGAELTLLQLGEMPLHSRPMPSVGRGAWEIKIRDDSSQYRVIYIVKRHESIHVLHSFKKKSRKTNKEDIELAKFRLTKV
jgi:phage-related protein